MRPAKEQPVIRSVYYGLKEAFIQFQQASAKAFIDTQRCGQPWRKQLPLQLRGTYTFIDRQTKAKKLCMVLAGYKPELWASVFGRLKQIATSDIDICILSSGVYSKDLEKLCTNYGWSYLSTKKNKLSVIQNLAIYLHPQAQYIYKLDEDIFLTSGFFQTLFSTYSHARKYSNYEVGYVAPLIPVNGYGYVRVLEKTGLVSDWEQQFGPAVYTNGIHHHTVILQDSRAAQYLWGNTQERLANIDLLNEQFQQESFSYRICPIRFSIGAILFTRDTWLDWGMFPVDWSIGMGLDEEWMARYCMLHGYVGFISENSLVGHLGYGPQTATMKECYQEGILQV